MSRKKKSIKDPRKVSFEVSLLSLLMFFLSLLGILNFEYVGYFLTYCFSFLFGMFYFVPFLFGILYGFSLGFLRRKIRFLNAKTNLLILSFSFSLLLLFSFQKDISFKLAHDDFINLFNLVNINVLRVNVLKLYTLGGGFIGYFSFMLIAFFFTIIGAKIIVILGLLISFFFLFKKPIIAIGHKIKNRKNKIATAVLMDFEIDEDLDFDISDERTKAEPIANESLFVEGISIFNSEEPLKETKPLEENVKEEQIIEEEILLDIDEIKEDTEVEQINEIQEETFEDEEEIVIEKNIQQERSLPREAKEIKQPKKVDDLFAEGIVTFGRKSKKRPVVYVEPNETQKEVEKKEIDTIKNDFSDVKAVQKTTSVEKVEVLPQTKSEVEEKPQSLIMGYTKEISEISDEVNVYDLLNENTYTQVDEEQDLEAILNVEKIETKLNELNIKAEVSDYIIGPSVTRYEIILDSGVRVSNIVNAENDLKLALAATHTRMEAPIPGKSAVGIEIPNKVRRNVYLKEVLKPFTNNKQKLLVGIGKDLENKAVAINLDELPHLLVAGATGSGKSVCLNSIIISLLIRTTPDEVRMLLIDPKRVEMNSYKDMPHLLGPVVNDPKEASIALQRVIKEMEARYNLFADVGVKNIKRYNDLRREHDELEIPYYVIIIDELADLMSVASKEVEHSIQRLTQLARAAGIYLIVATQRPSVDVITGIIKSNIPSRIAFTVSSAIDSRTILDKGGAEMLLGKGDMLLDKTGSIGLNRIQGAYVSDPEINEIVAYVKNKYSLQYEDDFLDLKDEEDEEDELIDKSVNEDRLYEEIKQFVIEEQRASTSLLQRKYSIGYARAANFIDRLEEEGIVSGPAGSRPRDVLIKSEDENENK